MAKTPLSDAEPRVDTRFLPKSGLSKARFDQVFKGGKRIASANFRVSADRGEGRIGIGTAKSIGSHARRNWVKRRIRESIRSLESTLRPDLDYILIASANVVALEFAAIQEEVRDVIERINKRWADDLESS